MAAFEFFTGCPRRIVPDNLKAGVCKPDLYDPKIHRGYAELAHHYGVLVDPARAYHPRDKATIEAHQRYIRSSFFAGRSWGSLAAMTADTQAWCTQVAARIRSTYGCADIITGRRSAPCSWLAPVSKISPGRPTGSPPENL